MSAVADLLDDVECCIIDDYCSTHQRTALQCYDYYCDQLAAKRIEALLRYDCQLGQGDSAACSIEPTCLWHSASAIRNLIWQLRRGES